VVGRVNIAIFLAGALAVVAIFMGGVKAGRAYESNTTIAADLKAVTVQKAAQVILVREVPKVVTKVVTREVEVVKEVERVVNVAEKVLAPDCVMPDGFGMLLVAAANGSDPAASGSVDAFRGAYDCRATLAAVLADLQAGWRNSARLEGMQEWAKLVTREAPQ
jgi:hypothetical protein